MTSHHRGPKPKLRADYRAPSLQCKSYLCGMLLCEASCIFIVECGIAHFLYAMHVLCMYSTFRHHPHPLGYPCGKFSFCRALHCWASLWRKIAHSITQSLTQLIWCAGNRSFCFGINQLNHSHRHMSTFWTRKRQLMMTILKTLIFHNYMLT